MTISTGSKISAWCKEVGEDYAKNQLRWAASEPEPREILPFSVALAIQEQEKLIREGCYGKIDENTKVSQHL